MVRVGAIHVQHFRSEGVLVLKEIVIRKVLQIFDDFNARRHAGVFFELFKMRR